jgi:tRNA (guanine37-N1)-methyltransferase
MVMKPEPLVEAIEAATAGEPGIPVLLTAPDGEPFTQALAQELAALPRWVVVCGHYEGIDERVREGWITREVSLGDYVLTGGELAALVMLDATVRLLPGVLGNESSAQEESFEGGVLEYPHYTRPALFRERGIPEVLTSGHHANVAKWRRTQALTRTRARRPDLWEKLLPLSKADQKLLDAYDAQAAQDEATASVRAEQSVRVDDPVSNPE